MVRVQYESVFVPPFNEGTHWAFPASPEFAKAIQTIMRTRTSIPSTTRGVTYSFAFFSAKHLGAGQYYLMTIQRQGMGKPFDGASNLSPQRAGQPASHLYWSATAYDRETHALIRNMQWASRASTTPGLQKNADGSVDIYFGPKAPAARSPTGFPPTPKEVRSALPPLRPAEAAVRQDLEAAGYRRIKVTKS